MLASLCIVLEPTDKPASEAVQLSERTLRALLEHGRDILLMTDAEGKLQFVSPSAELVFGYRVTEMTGESGFVYTDSADADKIRELLAELVAIPNSTVQSECRAKHRDGRLLDIEFIAQNLLHEPDIAALVFNAQDVTARNEATLEAKERERLLTTLAENAHDIIAVSESVPVPTTIYISPSVERILGYPQQLFYDNAMMHLELIHPDDLAKLRALSQRSVEDLSKPITLRWRRADGEYVWIEQLIVPRLTSDGQLAGTHSISRDVTKQIELETELRRSQKMEALGRLTGGIAHDFNNMMGVVRLATGCVRRNRVDDATLMRELAPIDAAIDRGISLVTQLQAFSRSDHSVVEIIDVHQALNDIEAVLRRLLPESLEISVSLRAVRPWIEIDPAGLEQLLINLAVNAKDAMLGPGELSITVTGDAHELCMSVKDQGVGIDDDKQEQIFDPFFTTKDPAERMGMGLSVVYGVVQKSHGRIEVESSPGEGTEFRITWPTAAHAPEVAAAPVPRPAPSKRETVLLVEDEGSLRSLIADVLASKNYEVLQASDVDQALAIAAERSGTIDLLLTDIIMPKRSGTELATELRTSWPDLRVLYISGYAGSARNESVIAESFLAKPFDADGLVSAVRGCLADNIDHPDGS